MMPFGAFKVDGRKLTNKEQKSASAEICSQESNWWRNSAGHASSVKVKRWLTFRFRAQDHDCKCMACIKRCERGVRRCLVNVRCNQVRQGLIGSWSQVEEGQGTGNIEIEAVRDGSFSPGSICPSPTHLSTWVSSHLAHLSYPSPSSLPDLLASIIYQRLPGLDPRHNINNSLQRSDDPRKWP